jgi:hypothetical protein
VQSEAKGVASMDRFAALAPQLRKCLGMESYASVREQIDALRFGEAAQALATLQVG